MILICLWIAPVRGQNTREEIEDLKQKTRGEIDYANQILEETRGKKEASLNDLSVIEHLLEKRKELIAELEEETIVLTKTIADNQDKIGSIEDQLGRIKDQYERMIIAAFKNRRKEYFLMYLLASRNMNQAYKRMRYYKLYNDYQRKLTDELMEMDIELNISNEMLKEMVSMKNENIQAASQETSSISMEIREKNIIVAQLESREKELLKEIAQKESVAKKLEDELKAIMEAERKKANNALLIETLTPEERLISDEFEKNKGRLPWPTAKGIVTGKYGEHEYKDYKSLIIRNDGIYISTVPGEEVRAIFKGEVKRVFAIPGENYSIMIQHGEYFTVYHNLINVQVIQGQEVDTGQLLGVVYTDQNTHESICYFQVWKDIELNNPEEWLSQ